MLTLTFCVLFLLWAEHSILLERVTVMSQISFNYLDLKAKRNTDQWSLKSWLCSEISLQKHFDVWLCCWQTLNLQISLNFFVENTPHLAMTLFLFLLWLSIQQFHIRLLCVLTVKLFPCTLCYFNLHLSKHSSRWGILKHNLQYF